MKRRTLLAGLGATAAGGTSVFATGAFTSVRADRTVSVTTADDNSAFLRLTPVIHRISGSDPATVEQTDGTLSIDVSRGGAAGVNLDATTWIGTSAFRSEDGWIDIADDPIDWVGNHTYTPRAAFGVENRGTQEYALSFEYEYSGDPGNSTICFHFYDGAAPQLGGSFPREYGTISGSGSVTVPADNGDESFRLGKRIFCSVEIDTYGGNTDDDLSGTLTIRAEDP